MNLRMIFDRASRLSSTTIATRFARKSNHNSHSYKNVCTLLVVTFFLLSMLFGYRLIKFAGNQHDAVYRPVVLDDVDAFPTKILSPDLPQADVTNSSCTFFGCFDVYKCGSRGNKLLVYVYPPVNYVDSSGKPVVDRMTREFHEILQTVVSGKFYTPNPHEACIFLSSVDTLNQNRLKVREASQSLRTLEFWNDGENHLIFNMIPGGVPDYNTVLDVSLGKAMIAGAGFSSLTYRSGFDISLPVYSPLTARFRANASHSRSWFAVSTQMNMNAGFEQDLMEVRANHPNDFLLLGPCLQYNPMNSSIRCNGQNVYEYVDVLQSATFCLVMRGARLGQSVLVEALAAGCIPVVVSDSLVMPFHGYIDWMRAAVFVREVDILTVIQSLKKISPKRTAEMRNNCIWLFEKYFSSMGKITEMTLEIIEDRVFPHLARDYAHWNLPQRVGQISPLFAPVTAPKIRGFTAVILTYDRQELLFSLITKLAKVPSLSKVLVIWNNQHKDPPPPSRWPKVAKPLKVIQTKQNKLSNRFYPYDEIETEAILSIDDDIIMLTVDEVEFAYEVWREFPDRIVGFPSRTHTWDNVTNCWRYESEWTNRISMVLTGAAFHHKLFVVQFTLARPSIFPVTLENPAPSSWPHPFPIGIRRIVVEENFWSYMYTTAMPGDIKTWVDDHMNCEDIAMNFLVANVTGKAPIKVTPKKKFRCPECTNTEMLSADLTHMVERTQCINRFSEIYQTMPLQSVEFRADPVLFKDQFPDKLKRFKEIGSL